MSALRRRLSALELRTYGRGLEHLSEGELVDQLVTACEALISSGAPLPSDWRDRIGSGDYLEKEIAHFEATD